MRAAGVLLHISSLPSEYSIGSLGKSAYEFVDFLEKSDQHIWQIMPICPTSYGDSPYQGVSAFAFNPYFIDLDLLQEDGLLTKEELPEKRVCDKADYGDLFYNRFKILHKAFLRLDLVKTKFQKFVREQAFWVKDYALYMVLKEDHNYASWDTWEDGFKYRNPEVLAKFEKENKERIKEWEFYQFLFYDQWMRLKKYAEKHNVQIMGDMPIYCAYDSVDVWSNPQDFQLDSNLKPYAVAGCPPDAFSADGQLWGNPLYNWGKMREDGYKWWVERVKMALKVFHILRIDHFRGFAGYFSIPYGAPNAKGGHWEDGPRYSLFEKIKEACPNANIVAENLGLLTPDVEELLNQCGYPGMNIFQFEWGDWNWNVPIYKGYPTNNVFYSGTHDNQMISSFYESLDEWRKQKVNQLTGIVWGDRPNLKIIEWCMKTPCDMCIIPLQDYLGLMDEVGRMNIPSKASGNWQYMAKKEDFSDWLSNYMKKITKESGR